MMRWDVALDKDGKIWDFIVETRTWVQKDGTISCMDVAREATERDRSEVLPDEDFGDKLIRLLHERQPPLGHMGLELSDGRMAVTAVSAYKKGFVDQMHELGFGWDDVGPVFDVQDVVQDLEARLNLRLNLPLWPGGDPHKIDGNWADPLELREIVRDLEAKGYDAREYLLRHPVWKKRLLVPEEERRAASSTEVAVAQKRVPRGFWSRSDVQCIVEKEFRRSKNLKVFDKDAYESVTQALRSKFPGLSFSWEAVKAAHTRFRG